MGAQPQRVLARVRKEATFRDGPADDAALFDDFRETYETLNAIDRLLLRHKDLPMPPQPAR